MIARLRRMAAMIKRRLREGRVISLRAVSGEQFRWVWMHELPPEIRAGTYEPEVVAVLQSELRAGSRFLDVGANCGYLALQARSLVGEEGLVVAVEPLAANVAYMRRLLELNPHLAFEVRALAVADRAGTAELQVTRNPANPRLLGINWEHSKPAIGAQAVQTEALADLLAEVRPDFVKIDTEGAEAMILEAAVARREEWGCRPAFLIEAHGVENGADCRRLLESASYSLESMAADASLVGGSPGDCWLARPDLD